MTTLCETQDLRTGVDHPSVDEPVRTDVDTVDGADERKYAKSGLQAVDCEDGNGQVLRLREGDGLLFSRNISPNILDRRENFRARDDDVLLATYPKSGTHWVWEILSLLKTGSDTLLTKTIQHVDYHPLDVLEALPSPRVLATHMPFSRISRDFVSRACKLIWVVRNPWDVAVSYFTFLKKLRIFDYAGDWHGFFELFLDGNIPYNSWFEHTQDWLKGMETTANILLVRYEDLHLNFKKEVQRIADFLNIQVTDAMLETIQRETSFANMKQKKYDITIPVSRDGKTAIYRKGQCGDWRNWFTEQQSAELRGAYRVSVAGAHRKILQYGEDTSIWARTTLNHGQHQNPAPQQASSRTTLNHNRHQNSEAQQASEL